MVLRINTAFMPYRLVLSKRAPVQLIVELENNDLDAKRLTMELATTRELSFEKGGFRNTVVKRLDSLEPGKKERFYFDIYPKQITRELEQPIMLKVCEHQSNYRVVQKEHEKRLELSVQE